MSEEILKALMQLFAILARQDGVLIANHEEYVFKFLSSQLSADRIKEYLEIYNEFLKESRPEPATGEQKDKNRTSMKDSVRTLSICKKINKTLVQKQKVIVLIRLLEFFKKDSENSQNRIQIVDTVAEVFKIEKQEFIDIKEFVFQGEEGTGLDQILIGSAAIQEKPECKHYIGIPNYLDRCQLIYLKNINIIVLKYHGNAELYLNGVVITPDTIHLFPQGSTLRLPQTSIYYSNIITQFNDEKNAEEFSFSAHIIEHKFPNGTVALNELRIEERSGSLIGIMGASGSGKTTLLTLLSGQDKPSNGEILINGTSVTADNQDLNGVIGYVPQDDLLIEDLSVYQNLYYNARLCFKDLPEVEINEKINKTLSSLGLLEIKDIKVGNALNKKISGGQRKRLNIALELLRQPHIIFLDEPTSGLSSRDSENVMDLLKELTIKGQLIFVVIHQPSSDIFKMFDKLFILDKGGFAAYYGNPVESVTHFKKATHQINSDVAECYTCGSVNPEIIFNLLELKEIDEYGNYTAKRRLEPRQFYQMYREKFMSSSPVQQISEKIKSTLNVPGKLAQTIVFFLRDLHSKMGNQQYMLINALEVPVLVLFLSLIIRYIDTSKSKDYFYSHNYNLPAYIFMSIIAAMLVGLTISAEEIYKDEKILKREKFLHLSRFSYLLSKVAILFAISFIQSLLFVVIGHLILDIRIAYLSFFIMLFSVFCFSNILGLILSSTFNSPVTIYIIIPLIIIPQLILGGAMFSYSKLNSWFGGGYKVPAPANAMVSRWAYEALVTDMFIDHKFNGDKFVYDKLESKFNYKLVYFIPKIEELVLRRNEESAEDRQVTSALLQQELGADHLTAKALGFQHQLPDLQNASAVLDYLKILSNFYTDKYNDASRIKEQFVAKRIKEMGGKKKYEKEKLNYYNSRLDEIVTSSFEKEKIVESDGKLMQIVDPIYQDPDANHKLISIDTHFLTASKYLFGVPISTYSFNLLIIWLMNFSLFAVLYFDLFKKLLNLPALIETLRLRIKTINNKA
jgi:ABC-type multidrug transport system ATPase subunit/ABC-type multidrug transport system permease subunit